MSKSIILSFIKIFFLQFIFITSTSYAFCVEPTAPDAPSTFSKPSPPFCLSGFKFSRKHDCDSWEIENYINEINSYIHKLNEYASEAVDYANEAQEYAKCQAQEAKEEIQ